MTEELTREEKLEDCLQRACALAVTTSDALVALIEAVYPLQGVICPRPPVVSKMLKHSQENREKLLERIKALAEEEE